jgi:hypothetical protein
MITHRQAEALWVARETGSALNLAFASKGGPRRIFYNLQREGYLKGFSITDEGMAELERWERHHRRPLSPLTKQRIAAIQSRVAAPRT